MKRWPADLPVPGSGSTGGRYLFNHKRGAIALSLSLLSTHYLDMTEILLRRTHSSKDCVWPLLGMCYSMMLFAFIPTFFQVLGVFSSPLSLSHSLSLLFFFLVLTLFPRFLYL